MVKKNESEVSEENQTKKFIEKYWPTALIVAGTAGAIGASIWLAARYLRERKNKLGQRDIALERIEAEVEMSGDESSALLETGTYLGGLAGEDEKLALIELASEMDDEQAREALELLNQVIKIDRKK